MTNELKIFNSDVIPVYETDTGNKVVIGRELYERLGATERYSRWFSRMSGYGFVKKPRLYPVPNGTPPKSSANRRLYSHS